MNLEDFIKNTLVGIKNGIFSANQELAKQENKEYGKDFSSQFVLIPENQGKEN